MVDNERLFKLYEAMMNSEEFISTKEIKELGITQAEIAKMVEDETLIRVKRGFYNFGNVNSLFMYGKSLIDSKRREDGIKVFEKCFSLDKTNLYAAYQLFINAVKVKDYDSILKYFDVMKSLFSEVNPIPVKAAMNLMGLEAGELRLPLVEISEASLKVLADNMKKCGIEIK